MLRKYAGIISVIIYMIALIVIFKTMPYIAAIIIFIGGIWKLADMAIVIQDWAEEKFQ